MNYELHAAAFVEESLRDDGLLSWHGPQYRTAGHHVFHSLLGSGTIEPTFLFQPFHGGRAMARIAANAIRLQAFGEGVDRMSKFGNLFGEFGGARRGFAQPERARLALGECARKCSREE